MSKKKTCVIFNASNVKLKDSKIIIRCNGEEAYKKFFEIIKLNKDDYKDQEEKPFNEK